LVAKSGSQNAGSLWGVRKEKKRGQGVLKKKKKDGRRLERGERINVLLLER